MKPKIHADQVADILDTLMACGISPFNVSVRKDGLVIFYSHGLPGFEVQWARQLLVDLLLRLEKGNG